MRLPGEEDADITGSALIEDTTDNADDNDAAEDDDDEEIACL